MPTDTELLDWLQEQLDKKQYSDPGGKKNIGDANAEFIVHACNQHDKLVAMLRLLEWEGDIDYDSADHGIPTCPCCCGPHTGYGKGEHTADCELAALLAEETEREVEGK